MSSEREWDGEVLNLGKKSQSFLKINTVNKDTLLLT